MSSIKKILFMTKHHNYKDAQLFTSAATKLGVQLDVCHYDSVNTAFNTDTFSITVNLLELSKYDLVFFRTVGDYQEVQLTMVEYCNQNSTPIVDSVFEYKKPYIDRKSFEYARLSSKKLSIIPTQFLNKEYYEKNYQKFEYPIVAKITNGSQGEGVYLCQSKTDVIDVFNKHNQKLLLQKYIPNSGDIRVFIIGNSVVGAIKRTTNTTNEFRNNVSLGGVTAKYKLNKIEESLALQAALELNYEIAGVDLINDQNGNPMVIEVNRSPQFHGLMETLNINIPELIVNYLISKIS